MTEPALRLVEPLVDPDTGEISPEAPSYPNALATLGRLDTQIRMMERDLAGKRLRIADLEADREAAAMNDELRPEVELVHAVWLVACHRKRPLHYADRERISRAVRKLGLTTCLIAVAGASYDPGYSKPRKNGKRNRYDDLELIFREFKQVHDFASRVPDGYWPDAAKVAKLGGVPVEWVAKRLQAKP